MSRPTPTLVAAAATAFHSDGRVDLDGCRALFDSIGSYPVDAVFVAGTTGEFVALSDSERLDIIGAAVDALGPQRVIAHIGSASAYQARQLAVQASKLGATRLAAITPYFSATSTAAAHAYFAAIREEANDAELFAYVFPARSGVHLTAGEIGRIVTTVGVDGVKVSIAGAQYVEELSGHLRPDVPVLSGNDDLLTEVLDAGGAGVVSGVFQVAPEAFVDQMSAVQENDSGRLARAQRRVDDAVAAFGPSLAVLKRGLVRRGVLGMDTCRVPIDTPTPGEVRRADEVLHRLGKGRIPISGPDHPMPTSRAAAPIAEP